MTVRMMRSTDRGAPALAGQQGSMCALLLATLVTGFPAAAPVGITRSGNVATCNMPGHGFVSTQTVSVFGATEAEYNGNQVITVVDADNFTFLVAGTPATPATGTISVGGEKTAGTAVSLTRSGATVTVNLVGHGFTVGQRARIVGANEAQYNGWQTVTTVADADNFTYDLPASATPSSPATGTIGVRYGSCGIGWSQLFAATNKKIFKQGARAGVSQCVVVVDETSATNHTFGVGLYGAENATDISTLVNPAYSTPYESYSGCLKSATATTQTRPWIVIGDHRTMIVAVKPGHTTLPLPDGWVLNYFGDIISYLPGDAYPQLYAPSSRTTSYTFSSASYPNNVGSPTYNSWQYYNYANSYTVNDTAYPARMTRNHLGVIGKVQTMFCSGFSYNSTSNDSRTSYPIGHRSTSYSYDSYPDPVHGGMNMEKLYIKHPALIDGTGAPVSRGEIRGLWNPSHRRTQVASWLNNDTIIGAGDTAGKTFEVLDLAQIANSWILLETSDTWGV